MVVVICECSGISYASASGLMLTGGADGGLRCRFLEFGYNVFLAVLRQSSLFGGTVMAYCLAVMRALSSMNVHISPHVPYKPSEAGGP